MKALLIGGVADGEYRDVDPRCDYLKIPHPEFPKCWAAGRFEVPAKEAVKVDNYNREYLSSGETTYAVFVHGDPTKIIETLIEGYRKHKEESTK
jgi:hypothetical protein